MDNGGYVCAACDKWLGGSHRQICPACVKALQKERAHSDRLAEALDGIRADLLDTTHFDEVILPLLEGHKKRREG